MTVRPAIATPGAADHGRQRRHHRGRRRRPCRHSAGAGAGGSGLRVNVNDLNRQSLDILAAGELPFIEHGAQSVLRQGTGRQPAGVHQFIRQDFAGGPVIITIGTPVDEFLNPVRQVVQDCIDAMLPALADGQLLVLRSTVFPGTTELAGVLSASQGPQAESGVLPGAGGAGQRAERIARDAADRQRLHAGGRAGRRRPVRAHHAGSGGAVADRGRVRQAVQQRLSLHRVRRDQRVLPGRQIGRRRLSTRAGGDEAQLSARTEHSAPGLRRRSLPGQGHHATHAHLPAISSASATPRC